MLVPLSLDEWLPGNHLARFIAELVDDELDLDRFYTSYAKAKGPATPGLLIWRFNRSNAICTIMLVLTQKNREM